jgi:hypothetical protein
MNLDTAKNKMLKLTLRKVAAALTLTICFSFAAFTVAEAENSDIAASSTETAAETTLIDQSAASSTTTITTGDSNAIDSTTNEINVNDVNETATTSGTTTPNTTIENASTAIANDNNAAIENSATTTSETGDNTASNVGMGGASITTGDSMAVTNVVNIANANIVDSVGLYALLNFLGYFGSFNIGNLFGTSTPDLPGCQATSTCDSGSLLNINNNFADILNNLIVRSSTGGNTASTTGNAYVETGDATALANILNVANTNIIDSNYLLLVFNNIGDWGGNLILPNKNFFDSVFFGGAGAIGNTQVSNNNQANIENTSSVDANTGNNLANASSSAIKTGTGTSISTTDNLTNTNIFGGGSFRLLIRVSGDWDGKIFGLPSGISWMRTPAGIELFSTTLGQQSSSSQTNLTIQNNNIANIKNNVGVYALTGENEATGKTGNISTGNAYAGSNIMNVANTNVIGANWLWAIINVFGNWHGNISFGAPDLWIGSTAKSQSDSFKPGSEVTLTFTIANRGDVDAEDVILKSIPNEYIAFNGQGSNNFMEWHVGKVPAKSSIETAYKAKIKSNLPWGEPALVVKSTVSSPEGDYNEKDNTDTLTILGFNPLNLGGRNVYYDEDPILTVTKTNFASTTIVASSTVKYRVNIKNSGGPAYHSMLVDTLRNEHGDKISEQKWNLDTIKRGEEITVDYVVLFNASTTDGGYINTAQVKAVGRNPSLNPFYGHFVNSNATSSTVTVLSKNLIGSSDYGVKEPATILENTLQRSVSEELKVINIPEKQVRLNPKKTKALVDVSKLKIDKAAPKTEEIKIKPILIPDITPLTPNTGVDTEIQKQRRNMGASAVDAYLNGASIYLMKVLNRFI